MAPNCSASVAAAAVPLDHLMYRGVGGGRWCRWWHGLNPGSLTKLASAGQEHVTHVSLIEMTIPRANCVSILIRL